MHKNRVVAHRPSPGSLDDNSRVTERQDKRQRTESSEDETETDKVEEAESQLVHLPTTGWKCPGIVPDAFYREHMELIHAFAKYYVGGYRINVVRDIRSDKVMLFSHDCENRIVLRQLPNRHDCCEKCYDIWLNNKSFRRILRKMDRYVLVENILRHSWSITAEDVSVLSNFKHSSDMNLNIEGRRLKQAAMTAVQHFSELSKALPPRNGSTKTSPNRNGYERVQQPLSMEVMLQLQSFDPTIHEGEGSTASSTHHDGNVQQFEPPNGYLDQQQNPPGLPVTAQDSSQRSQ